MADSQKEVVYKAPDLGAVQQGFGHPGTAPAAEGSPPQKTVCGLPRIIFWLIVLIALLVIVVIGIAVGLGVGLTRGQNSQSASAAVHSATTTPPSTTATFDGTSSRTTSAGSVQVTSVNCPKDDLTKELAVFEDDSQSYRIHCGSDFGEGKHELVSIFLPSFDKCLSLCHSMNSLQGRKDVGCTYNWDGAGGQKPGSCWCLGGSDKDIVPSPGRIIAVWA